MLSEKVLAQVLASQKAEVTEAKIYRNIAGFVKDDVDRETLLKIAAEEESHDKIWQRYTGKEVTPDMGHVRKYTWLARLFGYTFAIKLMEKGEAKAQDKYGQGEFVAAIPEARCIAEEEERHENALIEILDEEGLRYVGSIVLGLNDALVEISGSLAGFTLAYQNTRMTALAGLITGIAATLSMACSEYLSASSEGNEDAKKSCIYTGMAYLVTVALLVLPYLVLPEQAFIPALVIMLCIVLAIIAVFNYYISVAKDLSFKRRFLEMAGISMGVALLSFGLGILVKNWLGIEI